MILGLTSQSPMFPTQLFASKVKNLHQLTFKSWLPLKRKPSGVLRSEVPPVLPLELPPLAGSDPRRLTNTVSIRCSCGYERRDVVCLGKLMDEQAQLFTLCGGLLVLCGKTLECNRCRSLAEVVQFCCAFCNSRKILTVEQILRSAKLQKADKVHSTMLFAYSSNRRNFGLLTL
ncbi:unnamed protein product [Caenorhabditis auriculariae]|uniref:Uncharacterized protein n=1 Tax=Caenorhabditis auriculariae TaxID=2777116 RepID=A0A8S1I0F8_9PELO|nr:unnamed protein product [Caenorhabditis auriculariae]